MGATPTHQNETDVLDHEIWEDEAEGILQVPPRVAQEGGHKDTQVMLGVEGGTVCACSSEMSGTVSGTGSTALASTPSTHGPWSQTTNVREWYPNEHPFNCNTTDTTDPNETLYTLMMVHFPLYKRSYMPAWLNPETPLGFKRNEGLNYVDYPICQLHEMQSQQAHYTQVIMAPNPLVVALCNDTNKVYSKPLVMP